MLVAKNECTIYNNNILDFLREDWLPNNVLAHLDTVTMRHSLESRVPYLDHELVEFIYSLPVRHLYDLVSDKKILRKTGKKRGCKAYSRPKDTFSLPGANYRKTDYFRNLVDQYLSEQKLDDIPGLNGKKTSAMVRTNQKKDGLLADKRIITILNLSMWYSRIKDKLNNEQK